MKLKVVGSWCRETSPRLPGAPGPWPHPRLSFRLTAQPDSSHLLCPNLPSVAAHVFNIADPECVSFSMAILEQKTPQGSIC